MIVGGCTCVGPFVKTFVIRGTVVASDTGDALGNVPISVQLLTDGEVIGYASGIASGRTRSKTPAAIVTDPDGSFAITMRSDERVDCFQEVSSDPATNEIVRPDQTLVVVSLQACQQQLFIDLNEDTVLDITFPDNTIQLKDPILLPPCPE